MTQYNKCVLIGKFMPPHKGHEYMIRFAKNYSNNVHVIVDCLNTQTISPEQRKQWIEEEINGITVHALQQFMPQEPNEHPDFWNIWKNAIYESIGGKPDVLVASMDYGWKLSEVLECDFIPVDIARESIPISATLIREDLFNNWEFLMDSVKASLVKKFCILGPESTGKSVIGKKVADHFKTIYVPEYAKTIIEKQNGVFLEKNVAEFSFAQLSAEKALAKFSNKIMVCDSSALTTQIYGELVFNKCFENLNDIINSHKYEHVFLFYPDTPYFSDTHRNVLENPEQQRHEIFNTFENKLKQHNISYTVIKGDFLQKEKQIITYIENYLNNFQL